MNYFTELLRYIFRDLRSHKLRSLLAMFGIAWGTFSVVMLLAVGEAYRVENKSTLLDIAGNSLFFWPSETSKPYRGHPIGEEVQIKAADMAQLREKLPGIQWISPILYPPGDHTLSYGKQQVNIDIPGVGEDYALINKIHWQAGGRFFDRLDFVQARQVVFIGEATQKKLFGSSSPLGKQVLFDGIPFTIVGVEQEKERAFVSKQYTAYIPYSTAIKLWGDLNVRQFTITALPDQTTSAVKSRVLQYFSHKYGYDPTDERAIYFYDLSQDFQFFNWFFNAIEWFLALCGVMTLGIGGVGISNMMYLIVTERTAEIGLRMALGAQPHHILWQFLVESTVIVLLGSLIGLLLAIALLTALQHITLPSWLGTPVFSSSVFLVTTLVLLCITLIVGYFPAKRAAALLPIQALTF